MECQRGCWERGERNGQSKGLEVRLKVLGMEEEVEDGLEVLDLTGSLREEGMESEFWGKGLPRDLGQR